MNSMKKNGRRIFEIFSSEGPSEFLVVNRARLDEYQRMLVTHKRKSQEEGHKKWTES